MIDFDELFKNHQATRVDCGPLSIITYKKPDSFENGLRYIFDNELSTLTITGDWLKAVAVNVNNMGSPDRLYNSAYEPHFGVCRYSDYHTLTQAIVDMNSNRIYICEENLEQFVLTL